MKIGVPKEIKDQEARVAMVPASVTALVAEGNVVVVEQDAGIGSGFTNEQYKEAGASLVSADEAWDVELVVKVKEPQQSEYRYLKAQMVFTFFHLAGASKCLAEMLIKQKVTAIAYESLEDEAGRLPILEPMSAIAGNMSVLMGAYYLASFNHGNGMQLGAVLGQTYGKVVVIGDGVVGQHAARVAEGMGAEIIVMGLDENEWNLKHEPKLAKVKFVESNKKNIAEQIINADLVVGAVLCRGDKAPKVVTEEMLKTMRSGSVIVDVSIDQGGCFETSRPTCHTKPVFVKHGVIHYCVSNMPGAYPKASTIALTNTTIPYIQDISRNGLAGLLCDSAKSKAINIYEGKIVEKKLAKKLNLMDKYQSIKRASGTE